MARQGLVLNYHYLVDETETFYCGTCAIRRPGSKVPLVRATQPQRFCELDDPELDLTLRALDAGPVINAWPTPEEFDAHWSDVLRTEARVFEVVKKPRRTDIAARRREILAYRPWTSRRDATLEAEESAFSRPSSNDAEPYGIVEIVDDEGHCDVRCWRCHEIFRVDRDELALAVAHVQQFGGECVIEAGGNVTMRHSAHPFMFRNSAK